MLPFHSITPPPKRQTPPFSPHNSPLASASLPLRIRSGPALLHPTQQKRECLETELHTPKLDRLHNHLWLAGLPRPARPLHRQVQMSRKIVITESADEHLVWHQNSIFLKPIPEYLLCYSFWEDEICPYPELYQSACGLLLSYGWLISYKSDYLIATQANLLPDSTSWDQWRCFMDEVLTFIEGTKQHTTSMRYRYGELRLSRLTKLTRVLPGTMSFQSLVHGYMSNSTWKAIFFQKNFAWLLVAFLYLSTILSALQVGLATESMNGSTSFQNMSQGICLFVIAFIGASTALLLMVWVGLCCIHVISTLRYSK